jgi:hypothetical protein
MTKLSELQEKLDRVYEDGGKMPLQIHEAELLIRAVRQLGEERKVYDALFQAVDDNYKSLIETYPTIYAAYNEVTKTDEADTDVLELIGE